MQRSLLCETLGLIWRHGFVYVIMASVEILVILAGAMCLCHMDSSGRWVKAYLFIKLAEPVIKYMAGYTGDIVRHRIIDLIGHDYYDTGHNVQLRKQAIQAVDQTVWSIVWNGPAIIGDLLSCLVLAWQYSWWMSVGIVIIVTITPVWSWRILRIEHLFVINHRTLLQKCNIDAVDYHQQLQNNQFIAVVIILLTSLHVLFMLIFDRSMIALVVFTAAIQGVSRGMNIMNYLRRREIDYAQFYNMINQ